MDKKILRWLALLGVILSLVIANTAIEAQAAGICVHPRGRGGCYSTIQEAVNAAGNGDQIDIRGGRYVEQVTIIGKDLTFVGHDGAVVQAPADMEQTLLETTGGTGRPIIGVANAEVTIRNLTVDGLNSAANNPFLEGITFMNAGGVIRNNVIRNVGFGAPSLPIDEATGVPLYQGDPIVVINTVAIPREITIAENRIINYNDIGIIVGSFADPNDPTVANLTAYVLDNIVIGLGPTDVIDQWGIVMFSEAFGDSQLFVTGTIQRNWIRDVVSVDPLPLPAIGIELNNISNVIIAENTIQNANISIDGLRLFTVQIMNNRFVGPQQEAIGSEGIFLAGGDIQVMHNRFRKQDVGILLSVEDEFLGSALSTVLEENSFENVPVDVTTRPGASFDADTKAAHSSSRVQRYRPIMRP